MTKPNNRCPMKPSTSKKRTGKEQDGGSSKKRAPTVAERASPLDR
eukprot:CAMPEP_0174300914 /NCGR_PEP_ID=MMETSP0809-20121228/58745_1 /TAXON_ID=73025 ORGANISM="Eutreptiella gymnastica-like, Strain CCMP1594" /NCGR_SAMPLE_ID=MMETSP0809 /ASSEMBLY_ACC=CAM_ASM_000658 /LENGTH=44 /DNA_ID= /DNA_START= /DNA_END= /DNA_ORIENTATION=